MNVYKDLMFLHGHFARPRDAVEDRDAIAAALPPASRNAPRTDAPTAFRSTPMNLFKSLMYLGGLESVSPRIDAPDEAFGPTYGNRVAAGRRFGPAPAASEPQCRGGAGFGLDACADGGCH